MQLIADYIANAVKFERTAATERDAELRKQLEKQAAAYRKLAEDRAKKIGVPPPEKPL